MEKKEYVVRFNDLEETWVLTGKELINFIETAVVNNKDIDEFDVTRITNV